MTIPGKRSLNLTEQQNPVRRTVAMAWSLFVRFVSYVALVLVFYLIVTPIGLLMRIMGKDSMGLAEKADKNTCRVSSKARDPKHLEKPY